MPYERGNGSAMLTAENWCRHLTDNGTFSTASAPTRDQVSTWLTMGQADVMAQLVRYGYGTAAPSDPNGLAWLEKMNCLRACMDIEMTYPVTEWGQTNQRMTAFETQWDEGIEALKSGLLIGIGIVGSAQSGLSSNLVMTGTKQSRKTSRELDPDRVAGKFVRGFGQSPRSVLGRYYDPNAGQPQ